MEEYCEFISLGIETDRVSCSMLPVTILPCSKYFQYNDKKLYCIMENRYFIKLLNYFSFLIPGYFPV